MTKEEFGKKRFQSFEEIIYTSPESPLMNSFTVSCMLVGIDFEQDLLKLIPFPNEKYEEDPFWVRIEYCEKAPRKLKTA